VPPTDTSVAPCQGQLGRDVTRVENDEKIRSPMSSRGRTMNLLKSFTASIAIPIGAMALASTPLAVPNAFAGPGLLVKCQSMQSVPNSSVAPVELGGCNRPQLTGGSGTSSGTGPGPYPIIWATQKSMDFVSSSSSPASINRCPAPFIEFDFVGPITNVSGPWMKRYIGDIVAFDFCFDPNTGGVAELAPGTLFMIFKH